MSGMLNLSRNFGLITGASVMGAVFALASATIDITSDGTDRARNARESCQETGLPETTGRCEYVGSRQERTSSFHVAACGSKGRLLC
jgi:hypothetical protein